MSDTLRPSGFVVLRAPLLPVSDLELLAGPDAAAHLRAVVARPEVAEAIHIASPSLADQVPAWLAGTTAEPERVSRALACYVVRMASRPTPFGLFAGCATGIVGEVTDLVVATASTRRSRPDMAVLTALTERLARDRDTWQALTYVPNPTSYRLGGRLRLVESRTRRSRRSHHLVAVDIDDAMQVALDATGTHGAAPVEIAGKLAADLDLDPTDALAYVDELVAAQVLVSTAEPALTGPEPLPALVSTLSADPATRPVATALARVRAELAAIDATGGDRQAYRAVMRTLTGLVPDLDAARAVQVDLHRDGAGLTVGPAVVAELARAVELLHTISPGDADSALNRFRNAFAARYEDREVPLMEALDEELGIGFDASTHPAADESPLLADVVLGAGGRGSVAWTPRDDVVLRLLAEALREGRREITLGAADVTELRVPDQPPLPDALAVMATLAGADPDAGEFSAVVHTVWGPSGAQLLGRFCHGDAALDAATRAHLRAEEAARPDAVHAEVVHLPEGRAGNVIARPVLRGHEVVLLGRSGVPVERRLTLADLTLSMRADRLVLRSMRLGIEVVPRLSTAHNVGAGIGVYRFLSALQYQGVAGDLGWTWGPLSSAPFLPRVRSGRVVLHLATWRLTSAEIAALTGGDGADRLEAWRQLRTDRGLPQRVTISDGDIRLLVDTEAPVPVEAAAHVLRNRTEATLEESPLDIGELPAHGPAGRYGHELIVPFLRVAEARPAEPTQAAVTVARRFPPASEWHYAKVYTGTATADRVLTEVVAPAVDNARAAGVVDDWFFVRYDDPEPHLRLRFHGDPDRLRTYLAPALADALSPRLADGSVWRIQHDTYEREVERYGGDAGIAACETIFTADSDAVLALLALLDGDAGLVTRWQLCAYGIDRLAADFGLDLPQRRRWAADRRDAYAGEYPSAPDVRGAIGRIWRAEQRDLQILLDDGCGHPFESGRAALRTRSAAIRAAVAHLRAAVIDNESLLSSLAHMHAVRLLRSGARTHELILFGLLERHYGSLLARARSRP